LTAQHNSSERVSWSGALDAVRNTTLTSELGTTGLTHVGYRHESVGGQFQPRWQVTELWATSLTAQVQSDFYAAAAVNLVDYTYYSAALDNSWRLSQKDTLGVVVRSGRLRVPHSSDDVSDTSAVLRYARNLNERWSLSLSGGPAWTRGTGPTQRGENFSFQLQRGAQYGAVSLNLERANAPSGSGYLTKRDSASLALRREFSPLLSASLDARYMRSRNVAGSLGFVFNDVRYRRVEATLNRAVSRQWSAVLRAGYAGQQGIVGGLASGVDISLGVHWNGENHVF